MKIKTKLIIIAAALMIVTVTAFSIFLNIQLGSTESAMFDSYLSDLSAAQAAALDNYVSDIGARYEVISALPEVKRFTSGSYSSGSAEYEAAQAALDAVVSGASVNSVVIYDSNSNVELGSGIDNITNAEGICDVSAPDKTAVIFSPEGGTGNHYVVSIKGKAGDHYLGVAFSDDGLSRIISQAKDLVFIADTNLSLALPNKQYNSEQDAEKSDQYKDYLNAVRNAGTTPQKCTDRSGYIAYVTATSQGWKAVAGQDISSASKFSSSASGTVMGIAIAMLVVCLVVAVFLIITVTKPFYKIQDTLLKISRGDHEARVDVMSKNEYGDIARVFNDIVDNIIVSEARYRTIIEMSDNIIFEWNLQTKEVTFSNNFNKKFSYRAPTDNFMDSFLLKCKVHPEDDERYRNDLARLEKGEDFKHNEYRIKNIYGDYIWVLIRTSTIRGQNGEPAKIVGVIVDIDRSKKNEDVLTARASFDSLTGVYNRESIETVIGNELELIATRKVEFAILFIDIDDFKFYNDQYSHATGDQVLRFTATTIRNAVGDNGKVGRYGGDEFIVCVKEADSNDPAVIAENILNTLKAGFESDSGDRLTVNVSIGISIIKDNTKRVDEIIGQADDAMYRIKKSGKSNFGFLET